MTPEELREWLINEFGYSEEEVEQFINQQVTFWPDRNGVYRADRPRHELQGIAEDWRAEEEATREYQAAREEGAAAAADQATYGASEDPEGLQEFDEARTSAQLLGTRDSLQALRGITDFRYMDAANEAMQEILRSAQREYDNYVEQHDGEKPEWTVRELAQQRFNELADPNITPYTDLGDREFMRDVHVPSLEYIQDRLARDVDGEYRKELFEEVEAAIEDGLLPDAHLLLSQNVPWNQNIATRYRYALEQANRRAGRNRDDAEQMIREWSILAAAYAGGGVTAQEMAAAQGVAPSQVGFYDQDAVGYQANEWILDFTEGTKFIPEGPYSADDMAQMRALGIDPDEAAATAQNIGFDQAFMEGLPIHMMTLLEAKTAFVRSSGDDLMAMQTLLMEQGFYDAAGMVPRLGIVQTGEAEIWAQFINQIQANGHIPPSKVIQQNVTNHWENIRRASAEALGQVPGDVDGDGIPDNVVAVTSRETLGKTVENVVRDLTGRSVVDNDFKQRIVDQAQARERAFARALNGSFVANRLNQGYSTVADVDIFLEAISGQESGGDYHARNPDSGAYGRYQFMPGTWQEWAHKSGLGASAPMTEDNQDFVARNMASYYYNTFGNWYDAAIAWYMGPGNVPNASAQLASQGIYPTGSRYGQDILRRMRDITTSNVQEYGGQGVQVTDDGFVFVEEFDKNAHVDALIRAGDHAGAASWEYHNRASDFISMLGSTI